MACVNPDGTVAPVARAVLLALQTQSIPDEIAGQVRSPLYRVRSSLRELLQAGLVEERDGRYALTAAGLDRVRVKDGPTQGPVSIS